MKFTLLIALFLLVFSVFSQTGTVRGFVYEEKTGEPVIFTNVYMRGTSYGSTTDAHGFFSVSKIPVGHYTIMVTALGYDTVQKEIDIKKDALENVKLYVKQSSVQLQEVVVSAEKEEAKTQVQMSMSKITPKDINKLPAIGGQADIAQYLQVLPGVVFTGDQGGQLYIRGGAPIQNKVLLDGMIIYNPFHTIGLFSVFETDIMRSADVYTGGFNAQYGGRISSVMDITTRDGNKKRLSGKIGANTFGSKVILEGPLIKEKEPGGSSASFILTGKTSYLDKTSKVLYPYAGSEGLPFNFTDLYGKVSFNGSNGSKFNLFGFNFTDNVKWKSISDLNWNTWGIGSNFVLVPASSATLIDGNFAFSQYDITMEEKNKGSRHSGIDGFNVDMNFTSFQGANELKYGFQILGFSTQFQFVNDYNRVISQETFTTELSGYVKYKWTFGKLILDPGFRAQYYASLGTFSPEPRVGIKYNANARLRFKGAAGVYSQNLISANSERDVVNIFNGFLSGPENLQDSVYFANGTTKKRTHELQKANHAVLGFEYDLTKRININVEGYYKWFTQLSNINRNKIFEDNADNSARPDILKKDFIIETGDAYGFDVVCKYEYKRLYFWAVYSWMKSHRYDGINSYPPIFDRRNNVNLVSNYKMGKNLDWELSVRWNFGSGLPFTQTQGFYEQFSFADGINTNYTTQNGSLGVYYGQLNGGRLPDYHRLDINISKKFYIGENSELELNAGATNVYNRKNIFYFDRINYERVNQLPILPSVGVNMTF